MFRASIVDSGARILRASLGYLFAALCARVLDLPGTRQSNLKARLCLIYGKNVHKLSFGTI